MTFVRCSWCVCCCNKRGCVILLSSFFMLTIETNVFDAWRSRFTIGRLKIMRSCSAPGIFDQHPKPKTETGWGFGRTNDRQRPTYCFNLNLTPTVFDATDFSKKKSKRAYDKLIYETDLSGEYSNIYDIFCEYKTGFTCRLLYCNYQM